MATVTARSVFHSERDCKRPLRATLAAVDDYEVSATYFGAVADGLKRVGQLDAVLAACPSDAAAVLQNPWLETWHPARLLEAVGDAVLGVAGPAAFEEIGYRTMRARYGDIVLPMLKSSLRSSGNSPAAIFATLDGQVKVAMRGLDVRWKPSSPSAGVLTVKYPRVVGAPVEATWRGIFRFAFEVCQKQGAVDAVERLADGAVLAFSLSWVPPPAP